MSDQEDNRESSHTSSYKCYRVEARISTGEPKQLCGVLIGTQWRRVPLASVEDGQGIRNYLYCPIGERDGYLSYHAAKAVQYTMMANHEFVTGLELRVVEFQAKVSSEFTRTGKTEEMHRYSHIMAADDA